MGSLANLVSSLQETVNQIVTNMATDSAFILRATKTSNNKGGKVGGYAATTATAHDCFYAPVPESQVEREEMRGAQRRPGFFHKFVFRSDVDVIETDKIRRVAARGVPQVDMEIIRVTPQIGLAIEVIAYEENQLS